MDPRPGSETEYGRALAFLKNRYGIKEFDDEDWRALVDYYRASQASQSDSISPMPINPVPVARELSPLEISVVRGQALLYTVKNQPSEWPAIRITF